MKSFCSACHVEKEIATSHDFFEFCIDCCDYCEKCNKHFFISCDCDTEQQAISKFVRYINANESFNSILTKQILRKHIEKIESGGSTIAYLLKEKVILASCDPIKKKLAEYNKYGMRRITENKQFEDTWYVTQKLEKATDEFISKIRKIKLFKHGNLFSTPFLLSCLKNLYCQTQDDEILFFIDEMVELCHIISADFIKMDIRSDNILVQNGKHIPYDCFYIGIEDWLIGDCNYCKTKLESKSAISYNGFLLCPECAKRRNINKDYFYEEEKILKHTF